jgi:phosphate transport system permease protein
MTLLEQAVTPKSETQQVAAPSGTTDVEQTGPQVPPSTTTPRRPAGPSEQYPRRITTIRRTDVLALFGALAAALTATGLLWTQLSPFSGILGYVVTSWVLFMLIYAVLVSFDESRPTMRDRLAMVAVHSLGLVLLFTLVFIVVYTVFKGYHAVVHLNFFTQDMRSTTPLDPLTKGGITHAIVGTLIEVGIALVIAVPLGLLGAVFLHEVPGRFARLVRTVVEAMTALPDILAGLFIYATLILILGLQFCGFAAACALAVTILPIIIRTADVVLRLVPGSLREASYALGAGQWRTVQLILLPTARSGLVTAVILGTARAIGETAPVLLVAGANNFMNTDPVHGPMMSLPLFVYTAVESGQPNLMARGFGAAVVLLALVLLLFFIARIIGGRGPGELTAGQRRRRASQSRRDADRITARWQERNTGQADFFGRGDPALSEPPADTAADMSDGMWGETR